MDALNRGIRDDGHEEQDGEDDAGENDVVVEKER